MKVIIDKINKIPAFEPFNIVIPVESWEDLHRVYAELDTYVPEDDGMVILNPLYDAIDKERKRQQQGGITVYPKQEEEDVEPAPPDEEEEEVGYPKKKGKKPARKHAYPKGYDGTDEERE
jgi:hypothetical protein